MNACDIMNAMVNSCDSCDKYESCTLEVPIWNLE